VGYSSRFRLEHQSQPPSWNAAAQSSDHGHQGDFHALVAMLFSQRTAPTYWDASLTKRAALQILADIVPDQKKNFE
jgi:hypothetical protein